MPKSAGKLPEEVSKSKVKRDMQALQKIGEVLVGLATTELAQIPLPDNLLDAVNAARALKTRESIRRQLQYIGKIMRNVDVEPIQDALSKLQLRHKRQTTQFHEVEAWRERLIVQGDDAIQEFMSHHAEADRQQLRQFVRKAQHDRKSGKDTGGDTELFRFLRGFFV